MSIWDTKAVVSENINTGILPIMHGTRQPAITAAVTDAQKWIAISRTPISPCLGSSNTNLTTIGWNSFSNTKVFAFGMMRNTPS